MKETLKQRYDEKKSDVQKLWMQFEEERKRVEEAGAKSEDIDKLQAEFYEPYQSATEEMEQVSGSYQKALEMSANGKPPPDEPETKAATVEDDSPGRRVVESAQYKALQASGALTRESSYPKLDAVTALDAAETKTLLTSVGAPGTILMRNLRLPGVLPLLRQPLQLTQLMTVRQVSEGNAVEWVRHSASTLNAAEVAEATATAGTSGTKPESAVTFVLESTPLRMIAHWLPLTRQALSDMAMLRGIVEDELTEGVRRRVNTQVLNGDGIAPNLTGLLNTAGIGTQALAADTRADAIAKAITLIRLAFMEPNAIVMNPSDWQDVALFKDSTGNYMFAGPQTEAEPRIWGLPVVLDSTIAAGTALVGDFRRAVLYVRDGIAILTSDSHSDFFVRNMIVILAEGRYGFAVERPSAFVTVTGI